jgi:hypothetical protein
MPPNCSFTWLHILGLLWGRLTPARQPGSDALIDDSDKGRFRHAHAVLQKFGTEDQSSTEEPVKGPRTIISGAKGMLKHRIKIAHTR